MVSKTKAQKTLFTAAKIGAFDLKHRIVLPALSRLRAQWPSANPSDLMRDYYSQRASSGGLLIAEATAITSEGRPYHAAPGIYTEEHVARWKQITDAVHAKGGLILLQLDHAGRATSTAIGQVTPITASVNETFLEDETVVVTTPDGLVRPSAHRALETREVAGVVERFRVAAERAKRAGFDGVELIAGQGHLVEQFLQDGSNKRTDIYGGSIENRERFLIEIIGAVSTVWGADRVGVRVSPSSTFNGMGDSDPRALFRHLAERLNDHGIAYLHVIEPRVSGADTVDENQDAVAASELGQIFHGPIIAAGGFTPATAEDAVNSGLANLIAIGRHFTSNPDLPYRIENDLPLTHYDRSTFYGGDGHGYTDFPTYEETREAELLA
ncbi:N-ethylmaleimide reductase [Paraburkholderia sp. BL6665CI2N2]|uniref:alkene reductase n=1 Tax=Paraburkholderia sp. BL6665CI2N2 TaxID=1938806 RepID=UPI00106485CC|nr:alkene reductase [Paraburkholderia sp. BL6665CI2N2]TDY22041.1 N-ethylmaleimide reductase [Paraburkholderia sp. BL6665CI2N2]